MVLQCAPLRKWEGFSVDGPQPSTRWTTWIGEGVGRVRFILENLQASAMDLGSLQPMVLEAVWTILCSCILCWTVELP